MLSSFTKANKNEQNTPEPSESGNAGKHTGQGSKLKKNVLANLTKKEILNIRNIYFLEINCNLHERMNQRVSKATLHS